LNISSFIARRIVFQKNHSFSRFIIRLSAAATAISVAIMIMALAFVTGFQEAVANKVFSFWSHIHIQQQEPSVSGLAEELPSYKNDTIEKTLRNHPKIKWTDAFATKSAMLKTAEGIEGVLLKGVEEGFHKERIAPYIIDGSWLDFKSDSSQNPILISAYTAKQLQLKTGDKAILFFIEDENTNPQARPVRVCGIYKTSIEEYDKTFAITDLKLIQRINKWNSNQVAGYEVTLYDYRNDDKVSNALLDSIPTSWYATPVRKIYPNIFDWLKLQNTNRKIIIIIMCVVAIMNLITCLLILVLERSRMIGLLKSTGAMDTQIQSIFWQQGMMIALVGIVMGNILGLGLCWLQQSTGFIRLDEAAYYVSKAPVELIVWQVLLINAITFIISMLVLLIPSLLVRNIKPVKALRFE
jgi:lipoprotein-releasing system permease protein